MKHAPESTVEQVVQEQFDAYNAHDLDRWANTYAEDAKQFQLGGNLLAAGRDSIRARMVERFREPDLHATLSASTWWSMG